MFTLFDEIVEDDRELGGISEGEGSERVERRFIGSFSLPFSTVFKEGRIEGAVLSPYPLPLSCPAILSIYPYLSYLIMIRACNTPRILFILYSNRPAFKPKLCIPPKSLHVLQQSH